MFALNLRNFGHFDRFASGFSASERQEMGSGKCGIMTVGDLYKLRTRPSKIGDKRPKF